MLSSLQIDFTSIMLIVPLVVCCALMYFQGRQSRGGGPSETESWFASSEIQDTFDTIDRETNNWVTVKPEPKPQGVSLLGGAKADTGFKVVESMPPRLHKLFSGGAGLVTFELTEVAGGGTLVKSTFGHATRAKMQRLKAQLPLRAYPLVNCEACGKPVLPDYLLCPYCGQKQAT